MSSLDEIKKKLNIDELDKETRNNMFNKFVEHGGQVVKDKKKNINQYNKSAQKVANDKYNTKNDKLKENYKNKSNSGKNYSTSKKNKKYLSVFFKGIFQGVFTFSNKFSKKFSLALMEELNETLSSLNYYNGFILNLEPEKKIEAIDILNKNISTSMEIIMRIYNLYKVQSIIKIQNYCKKFNDILCPEIIEDIRLIYKELIVLYPFWESVKEVIWRSFGVYQNIVMNDPLLPKQKLNKYIDSLFGYFFPAFHIILNYNDGKKLPFDYVFIYEDANISHEEEMGSFTKAINEEKQRYIEQIEAEKEERKKILQESIDKKEMDKIPKYIQKGLEILDSVIDKIRIKINDDSKGKLLEKNEKMYQFHFLLKDFDTDYSFILTTSQIRLSPRSESGKRIDIKSEFDELNIKYNEIGSFSREYYSLMEQFNKVKDDFANNPIVLQQKISIINIKRAQTFNEIRTRAAVFLRKFAITLQKLINDYNEQKLLLQNGDDILSFEHDSGSKKKFQNISIIKAIAAAFTYSSAFHYYLTVDKLSSKSIYMETENKEDDKALEEEEKKEE